MAGREQVSLAAVTFEVASDVPQPSAWAMMALGFAGLGFVVLRSRRATALAA